MSNRGTKYPRRRSFRPKFNPCFLKISNSKPLSQKRMSDHIPFEIQSEIIKKLPVKSIIQFHSVSKQWRCFIDSPEFIKNYHINHTNPQRHLFVCYELGTVQTYTSVVDNNTFPKQKFSLNDPETLVLLRDMFTLSSVDGLLCFYGSIESKPEIAIIWNPTIRKSVGIVIPRPKSGYIVIGFGVCPDTSDPKLVKITVDHISSLWVVEAFTLSARIWKTLYMGVPIKSGDYFTWIQVFVDGVIYFRGHDGVRLADGFVSNIVLSFDLKSEKFREVCLPEILVHAPDLEVTMVNESLGLLDYYDEGDMLMCGVWTRKDGVNKPFTKIYAVNLEGMSMYNRVLGFRNNGEAVQEVVKYDNGLESGIKVYEPLSGKINDVGINGYRGTFIVKSYMETLLLLHQPDSIIY